MQCSIPYKVASCFPVTTTSWDKGGKLFFSLSFNVNGVFSAKCLKENRHNPATGMLNAETEHGSLVESPTGSASPDTSHDRSVVKTLIKYLTCVNQDINLHADLCEMTTTPNCKPDLNNNNNLKNLIMEGNI